jgi:hypothetical protein
MKVFTTTLMVFGVFALLGIILLIAGVILFSMNPPIKADIVVSPVTPDASKSFSNKIDTFKRDVELAANAKEKKEFTLIIAENELNSKIVEQIAEGKLPFKELVISLHDDSCWLYFMFNNPGINAKGGIITKAEVVKGNVKLNLVDLQLGMLPLPNSINEYVGSLLDVFVKMEDPTQNMPMELNSIKFADKKVTIKVLSRPASQ